MRYDDDDVGRHDRLVDENTLPAAHDTKPSEYSTHHQLKLFQVVIGVRVCDPLTLLGSFRKNDLSNNTSTVCLPPTTAIGNGVMIYDGSYKAASRQDGTKTMAAAAGATTTSIVLHPGCREMMLGLSPKFACAT